MHLSGFQRAIDVPEDALTQLVQKCGWCQAPNLTLVMFEPAVSQTRVSWLRCLSCSLIQTSHHPSVEYMSQVYGEYYKESSLNEMITFDSVERIGKYLNRLFINNLPRKNRLEILDVGGGDGSISCSISKGLKESLSCEEISITVIESKSAIKAIRKFENVSYQHVLPRSQFDIILLSAVLEHVHNPRELFQYSLDHLEKGGVLYIRTPEVLPLAKALSHIPGLRIDTGFPHHLYDFPGAFFQQLISSLDPKHYSVILSQPSIPESRFFTLRGLVSRFLKLPGRIRLLNYEFTGGREILIKRLQ